MFPTLSVVLSYVIVILTFVLTLVTGMTFVAHGYTPMVGRMSLMLVGLVALSLCTLPCINNGEE